ncbi:MAG: 2-phospho-L-lactate transferase [Proteobacteria bacterium]|nr:2-phospho-L-lactate transferase [Pseudomonadota bacterium]
MSDSRTASVIALSGGIGGAKLALGLCKVLPPGGLTVIVNTADDFDHLGLRICPDIDTVLYTLAGLANPTLGWGRRDETWSFMQALESLGGETWFRLGDRDLALHVERTRRLHVGDSLTAFTADVARRWRVRAQVLPMSDDPVRTRIVTAEGELAFQDYFVRRRCAPPLRAVKFHGAPEARVAPQVQDALRPGQTSPPRAIIICPSNPYLSVDPILALPGMRALLRAAGAPVIAVTPLIGGEAVKGPTAKIMRELGLPPSPLTIANHYAGLIDGFVLDERDADLAGSLDLSLRVTNTLMSSLEDRERLAREVLQFADALARPRRSPA